MKRVLIGHRGVGKTRLLKRHASYFPTIPHFDLDHEIEKKYQLSITEFFKIKSESEFREAEQIVYQEIMNTNQYFVIALGAGFSIKQIGSDVEVFFITRLTDADGRIFLNRPRLHQSESPLLEYQQRYIQREAGFRLTADFVYHLPEGLENTSQIEEQILKFNFKITDAYYTLSAKEIPFLHQRIKNFSKIELRTDLLTDDEIQHILKKFPAHHWLVSIRTSSVSNWQQPCELDCDFKFFKNQKIHILSTHQDQIDQALVEIKPFESLYNIKLCPLIENFEDLKKGYLWQQQSPATRSFLPRSKNGRWNWFRLLSKYNQKINFVRNLNKQEDQPTLYQWLGLTIEKQKFWAAVVGKPVHFSRSPIYHEMFFAKQNSYMCQLELSSEEFKNNMSWLHELGLSMLAVTSPLKETAYEISAKQSDEAQQLKAVNTLLISNNQIFGQNTDLAGFKQLIKNIKLDHLKNMAVWGGGGTLQMLKSVLPDATYFSSQTGRPRDLSTQTLNKFTTLIWAAPRKTGTLFPPLDWPIKKIIDLNYIENSMGLEYAQKMISNGHTVEYISGIKMFEEQASQQQQFWSSL